MRVFRWFPVLLIFALAGCSRAVSVGSETGGDYSVLVNNTLSRQVTISWDDGSGNPRQLGTVAANSPNNKFIIVSPARPNVTIYARDSAGRSYGPYSVSLAPGTSQRVTIR